MDQDPGQRPPFWTQTEGMLMKKRHTAEQIVPLTSIVLVFAASGLAIRELKLTRGRILRSYVIALSAVSALLLFLVAGWALRPAINARRAYNSISATAAAARAKQGRSFWVEANP